MVKIYGTNGNDIPLEGTLGADTIYALDGDDVVRGYDGADKIEAGLGDDVVHGGLGSDLVYGGVGNDWIDGDDDSWRGSNDQLHGGDGNDILGGNFGDDRLWGDAGDDQLADLYGANRMFGGAGNDVLTGTGLLDGGAGDDTLQTVIAYEPVSLNGGDGNDTFVVGLQGNDGDVRNIAIEDFQPGDKLDVSSTLTGPIYVDLNHGALFASLDSTQDGQLDASKNLAV